jgi:SPP1 family phage portal protein
MVLLVIPIWSDDLDNELEAVLRIYPHTDESGDRFKVCQYWNKEECYAYSYKMSDADEAIYKSLKEFDMFAVVNGAGGLAEYKNVLSHGFGEVPFIPFFNNNNYSGDLWNVKPLIDTYDKVFSGFVDDLEDIQEVIFVLSGYGGESGEKFLQELKKYKTVNIDNTEGGSLTTLNIEIPVEARKEMLALCRKAIFEQGQGVDPDPQNFGNSSGVALKFLYSLLDLKAGLAETEFKLGFGRLIRMICGQWGFEPEQIIQTWTRTAVTNDLELADICVKSSSIISKLSAVKNHPFVENAEAELEKMKEEKQEAMEEFGEGLFNGNLKMGSSEAVRSDEKEYKEKDKR